MKKGLLITIEGIDGSGKGTQAGLLYQHLLSQGQKVKLVSFPRYDTSFFGSCCGAYLRGEYGTLNEVHPKLAAMLFAQDRAAYRDELVQNLEEGYTIICDRYVLSNCAYQSARTIEPERAAFVAWLSTLEYGVNKMPVPDITLFMDIEPEVARKQVRLKAERSYTKEKEDLHEANSDLLVQTDLLFRAYARAIPIKVNSGSNGIRLTHDAIYKKICDFSRSR